MWAERSPINKVNQIHAPLLLLQGTEDKVVPPSQAESMFEALRDSGRPVALRLYPGEGHGFLGKRTQLLLPGLEARREGTRQS